MKLRPNLNRLSSRFFDLHLVVEEWIKNLSRMRCSLTCDLYSPHSGNTTRAAVSLAMEFRAFAPLARIQLSAGMSLFWTARARASESSRCPDRILGCLSAKSPDHKATHGKQPRGESCKGPQDLYRKTAEGPEVKRTERVHYPAPDSCRPKIKGGFVSSALGIVGERDRKSVV